ncbi:hypothetical protein C8R45DRAFT_932550 [Mycena sanguinolenta]|nr:hypothetical protein C8R45DRAFT_932550 [Mycena sanguinolenta]
MSRAGSPISAIRGKRFSAVGVGVCIRLGRERCVGMRAAEEAGPARTVCLPASVRHVKTPPSEGLISAPGLRWAVARIILRTRAWDSRRKQNSIRKQISKFGIEIEFGLGGLNFAIGYLAWQLAKGYSKQHMHLPIAGTNNRDGTNAIHAGKRCPAVSIVPDICDDLAYVAMYRLHKYYDPAPTRICLSARWFLLFESVPVRELYYRVYDICIGWTANPPRLAIGLEM